MNFGQKLKPNLNQVRKFRFFTQLEYSLPPCTQISWSLSRRIFYIGFRLNWRSKTNWAKNLKSIWRGAQGGCRSMNERNQKLLYYMNCERRSCLLSFYLIPEAPYVSDLMQRKRIQQEIMWNWKELVLIQGPFVSAFPQ